AFWLRLERALRTNSCRFWNSSELAPSSPAGAAVLMRVASFMVSSREGLSDNLIVSSMVWLDPSPIASGASAPSRKLLWLPSPRAVSKAPGIWMGGTSHDKMDGLHGGARLERARCDVSSCAKHDLDQH